MLAVSLVDGQAPGSMRPLVSEKVEVKVFNGKPGDLSLTPGIHTVAFLKDVL